MPEPKAGKRKPGLRLTSKHLQTDTPPNNTTGASSNSNFREQIGNIVHGESGYQAPVIEQETSLAASFLAQNNQQPTQAPLQRPSTTSVVQDEQSTHFMEMKAEDLETLSRLGEGAAGTVRKVLHKPTGLIMAKKVYVKRFMYKKKKKKKLNLPFFA